MLKFSFKEALIYDIYGKLPSFFFLRIIKLYFLGHPALKILFYYRFACYCKQVNHKRIALHILKRIFLMYGVHIGYHAEIDYGFFMPHPTGVVIGEYVKIGKNCKIYQQVTIGAKSIEETGTRDYPCLGDNIIVYPGARIIGGIHIGNNVVIGPNAVVIKDVPDNSVAVGVPARITKKERQ
jgi:serine O-acetyltransferase